MATRAQPEFLEATYGSVCRSTHCGEKRRRTLESVVHLAVELAREGREGRKIGTLFVIGDVDNVLAQSRSLLLDPLYGHSEELLHVERPEFRETVKELAQLDGAFVVKDDGTFVSAGRYVDVEVGAAENFLPGLGTRHAAAASVSRQTNAIAVVVSQSVVDAWATAGAAFLTVVGWIFIGIAVVAPVLVLLGLGFLVGRELRK